MQEKTHCCSQSASECLELKTIKEFISAHSIQEQLPAPELIMLCRQRKTLVRSRFDKGVILNLEMLLTTPKKYM